MQKSGDKTILYTCYTTSKQKRKKKKKTKTKHNHTPESLSDIIEPLFRDFPAFQNLGPGALDFGEK